MRTLLKTALAFGLSVGVWAGDLTLTSKITSKKGGTQVQYFNKDRVRTNESASRIDSLVDFSKGRVWLINHAKKQVETFTFDDVAAANESLQKKSQEMPEAVMQMLNKYAPTNPTLAAMLQAGELTPDAIKAIPKMLGDMPYNRDCEEFTRCTTWRTSAPRSSWAAPAKRCASPWGAWSWNAAWTPPSCPPSTSTRP